jgi:hypothetical protein
MKLQLLALNISTIVIVSIAVLPILAIATFYQTVQARVQVRVFSLLEPAEPNNFQANNTFNIDVSNTTVIAGDVNGDDTADLIKFAPGRRVNAISIKFFPKPEANVSLLVVKDTNQNDRIDANDVPVFNSGDRSGEFKHNETLLTAEDTHFLAQVTQAPNTTGANYSLMLTGIRY